VAGNRLHQQVSERLASAARSLEAQNATSTKLNVFGAETPAFNASRKAA
jgi:hypothetical protein